MTEIQCKTCDQGVLTKQRVYRMSGPVVTIGYILLVPSVVGIIGCAAAWVLMMVGTGASMTSENRPSSYSQYYMTPELERALNQEMVPTPIIQQLKEGKEVSEESKMKLTPNQQMVVSRVEFEIRNRIQTAEAVETTGGIMAAGCTTFFLVIIAIISFVSGLLGWLLIMKKNILVCSHCGATVSSV